MTDRDNSGELEETSSLKKFGNSEFQEAERRII
jgi:hypothetical protein